MYPDTAALLEACRKWVHRFMVLSHEQGNVIAAWILHTWAIEAADSTPYLDITAPEKGCGKSRLLEVLEIVVRKPVKTGGMSAAALMRTVEAESPTLLLDEVDATFKGNKEVAEALRGMLNEGYRRGGNIRKCVPPNWDVKAFRVFSPKALAGIGRVPETIASRSITVEMRRKKNTENVENFRMRDARIDAIPLVESLRSWSESPVLDTLKAARPEFPKGFTDRQEDVSEPLLAIADLAGGEWPKAIRHSLSVLFRSAVAEDSSLGTTLLRDIRSIFVTRSGKDSDRLYSAALAAALCEIEGSPWSEWDKGRGLNPNALAKRLKPFHIHPQTIRTSGGTGKGYKREDFTEAWERYLPPQCDEAVTPVTTPVDIGDYSPFKPVTPVTVTDGHSRESPRESPLVTAVTPVTAPLEQEEPKRFLQGVM